MNVPKRTQAYSAGYTNNQNNQESGLPSSVKIPMKFENKYSRGTKLGKTTYQNYMDTNGYLNFQESYVRSTAKVPIKFENKY